MTEKTKKQLRAEAVEHLRQKWNAGTRDVRQLFAALVGTSTAKACASRDDYDALIDLLTDDANDDSAPESGVSGSELFLTPESCRQHADQPKQGDDADCGSCDSREKLEADVRDVCWGINIYRFDSQKLYLKEHGLDVREDIVATNYEGHVLVNVIMHLLDRQAAITQHEITERRAEHLHPIERECGYLRRKVAELTEERDEAVKAYDAHMAAHDSWHEAEDITYTRNRFSALERAMNERIAELTAERDELQERADYSSHGWAKANIGWAEANAEAEKWRTKCDEYRKKLGSALDASHEQEAQVTGGTLLVRRAPREGRPVQGQMSERKEESMKLKVKLTNGAPLPRHAKLGDAGLDLTSREDVVLWPHETKTVGTGVAVEIPEGYVGLCFPRSGLATRTGVVLANCVGVIDSGYRGEIQAPLHNISNGIRRVKRGERVFQLAIVPFATCECVEVDELTETERGADGFGSSGSGALDA